MAAVGKRNDTLELNLLLPAACAISWFLLLYSPATLFQVTPRVARLNHTLDSRKWRMQLAADNVWSSLTRTAWTMRRFLLLRLTTLNNGTQHKDTDEGWIAACGCQGLIRTLENFEDGASCGKGGTIRRYIRTEKRSQLSTSLYIYRIVAITFPRFVRKVPTFSCAHPEGHRDTCTR